ncbi:hypothetical protein Mapa_013445 [Marchantia paleacea]|nr:hypothetical protein Mapa_013445 [Marchantia paleacea]
MQISKPGVQIAPSPQYERLLDQEPYPSVDLFLQPFKSLLYTVLGCLYEAEQIHKLRDSKTKSKTPQAVGLFLQMRSPRALE